VELPTRLRTAAGTQVSFETICEKHAVIGDAALVAEKIKKLGEQTGATQVLAWFNIGTVPHALVKESMERFTKDVTPKL
jgi:alkanesulfonate monooxygenase SsuD/methylene tetrahydromethanopterin reductase-like flavin-dependent oxidoreductase (luciferase family)